jgi:hypothetical protein
MEVGMKRHALFRYYWLGVVVLLAACGGAETTGPETTEPETTEPETPSATGVWSGAMVTPFGAARTIAMSLQETGTEVSGSGDISDAVGDPYYSFTVTGTHVHPAIELSLSSPGFAPVSVEGEFTDATTIAAALNGSGWADTPVTLKRQ